MGRIRFRPRDMVTTNFSDDDQQMMLYTHLFLSLLFGLSERFSLYIKRMFLNI